MLSVPSQRVFNHAGMIKQNRRATLTVSVAEVILSRGLAATPMIFETELYDIFSLIKHLQVLKKYSIIKIRTTHT